MRERAILRRLTQVRKFVIMLAAALVVALSTAANATADDDPATDGGACGAAVNAESSHARTIGLVIDDSGSMFADDSGEALDRWSQAKYSLEVFAALLGPEDTLNVYRMSDFSDTSSAAAQLQLKGSEPTSSRVAKIHGMQLVGGGTPYNPVRQAYKDLVASEAATKWLIVLTDGEFNDRETSDVQTDLRGFVKDNTDESSSLRVAFLSIGPDAPAIANEPEQGIYYEKAPESSDLLGKMTAFSNVIFERNLIPQSAMGAISPDIPLAEAVVFAQGQDVSIGDATTPDGAIPPASTVTVSWAQNQDASYSGREVPAVPNQDLLGALATYNDLPEGNISFDVSGAQVVDIFYTPQVDFGVELLDENGARVDADKIVGGEYTVRYGFMDDNCSFIESPLLGDVTYSARVVRDGDIVADNFQSGDVLDLEEGSLTLEVAARYLGNNTSTATIDLQVLRPASPTSFEATSRQVNVSETADGAADAIELHYQLDGEGGASELSPEEWKSISAESISVSTDSNLVLTPVVGSEVGEISLTANAPDGDMYAADTGQIAYTVEIEHVFDEQVYGTTYSGELEVIDDISWWDRFQNWFFTMGWKFLIGFLVLLLILGYLFKKRFPKRIKKRPTITGIPTSVGARPETAQGKFRVKGGRRYLPFVADKATLSYTPPGVPGFRQMKLRAGPRKTLVLENWKAIAEKENVEINGNELNKETKRPPVMSATATITSRAPQVRYETTLNA